MEKFCTRCGAQMSADQVFCTACGAQQTASAAAGEQLAGQPDGQAGAHGAGPAAGQTNWQPVGQPVAGGAPTPLPYGAVPLASPPKSNAVKVILIVVGVLVGLGVLVSVILGFTLWRVAKSVHVDQSGENVTVHTPGGDFSANSGANAAKGYSAAELGMDVYPGATTGEGSMKMSLPTGSMVTGVYMTSDSKDKVVEYYRGKMGAGASVVETPTSSVMTSARGEGESVMVTVSQEPGEHEGKTQIAIVHMKKNGGS